MPETLRSEATVHLFGRKMDDLELKPVANGDGPVADLLRKARPPEADAMAEVPGTIARIYAFAFQNEYVELASPALFVLYVPGNPVASSLDRTGLARIPQTLNPTLTVWTVERDDMTVRLDVMTGSFSRVLLDYELADSGLQDFVRGGEQLGRPSPVGGAGRSRRRRWRSDDE